MARLALHDELMFGSSRSLNEKLVLIKLNIEEAVLNCEHFEV